MAGGPNPTGATGTQEATGLDPRKFVNLPCCPVHPKWITATGAVAAHALWTARKKVGGTAPPPEDAGAAESQAEEPTKGGE